MCAGYTVIHAQCLHSRSIKVTTPCDQGCDQEDRCLANDFEPHVAMLEHPSLCRGCCLREETHIHNSFKQMFLRQEECITRATAAARGETDQEKRRILKAEVSKLIEELGDLKDERLERLFTLRDEQGMVRY